MIRALLPCFFLFLFSQFKAFAQSFDYQFEGTIDIHEVGVFDYALNFNVDELGALSGVSISDVGGTFETQSKIEGTLNQQTQVLRFREVSVISSRVEDDEFELCLIQSEAIDFDQVLNETGINCNFVGKLVDGKQCGKGMIQLASIKPFPLKEVVKPELVIEGSKDLSLEWIDKTFILEIWDNQREDGDSVQVLINGTVNESFAITKSPQTFQYSLGKGSTIVTIKALNEGSAKFNTLIGKLIDGETVTPFKSQLSRGQSINFNLVH